MKRLVVLVLIALTALILTACATSTPPTSVPPTAAPTPTAAQATKAPEPTKAPEATKAPTSPAVLKLDGPGGSKSLTLDDLKSLPATEGWAGIKSSTGKITIPERFKGIALDDLAQVVGGLGPDMGVNLAAKDGYMMTISSDQIAKGDFIAYDPATGDEVKLKDTLKAIIAYEKEGKPLPEDSDGTLRLVVVSRQNNQVTDGHWSVKWVVQVSIKAMATDWKLPMGGAIADEIDRATFQSCAAPACHGKTWTDDKANVWSGVPLWLLAGRVDDEIKHGDGSFDDKLADQGYQVHVVAADGTKVVLESARIKRNDKILVAYLMNNNPLDEKDAPLRLVGGDLKTNEMLGKISKINLMLAQAQAAATTAPTAAPTAKPIATTAPTTAPAGAGKVALTITGAVDQPLSLTSDALKAMPTAKITAEHPKQGTQNYEGVRLLTLLDQAKVKSNATKLVMTSSDGFVSEVALADASKCADCLLAFADGKLNAVMPGMQSNFWSKDVVKIEVK